MRKHKYTLQRNNKMEKEKKKENMCTHAKKSHIHTESEIGKEVLFLRATAKKGKACGHCESQLIQNVTAALLLLCKRFISSSYFFFFYGGSLPFFTDKTKVKTHRKKKGASFIYTHKKKKKNMHTHKIALS